MLAVVTGGGSALLSAPVSDMSLSDLQTLTDKLLASGAAIGEINAVRKHISALKADWPTQPRRQRRSVSCSAMSPGMIR